MTAPRSGVPGHEIGFRTRDVQPGAPFYVRPNSSLRLFGAATIATTWTLTYRLLDPRGGEVLGREEVTLGGAGSVQIGVFPLPEGFLLSAYVRASGATSTQQTGRWWASLELVFGRAAVAFPYALLAAGPLTDYHGLGWPGAINRTLHEGPGEMVTVVGANPAAGAEWTIPVPATEFWHVVSVRVTLVASAAVANRTPALLLDDGATELCRVPVSRFVTAGQTAQLSWTTGANFQGPDSLVQAGGLPPTGRLLPGSTVRGLTLNLQGGDDYSAPTAFVERWPA